MIIGLHQEDERITGVLPRRPYIDFGMAVLKMEQEAGSSLILHKDYLIQRDTEVELILEPGQYLVVPRTTGCGLKKPDTAEAESIRLMDNQGHFHPTFISTITDIFNKFDLVISHTIDFKEFKGFLEIIGRSLKSEEEWKQQISSKFNCYEDALTLRGFKDWWKQ